MSFKKTLLITVPNGTVISSLLFTGCVQRLAKAGVRVVMLVPDHIHQALARNFSAENILFERIKPWHYAFYQRPLVLAAQAALAKRLNLLTIYFLERYNQLLTHRRWRRWVWFWTPGWKGLQKKLTRLFKSLTPSLYDSLMTKYSPELMFSNDPYRPSELPLMVCAQRRRVPLMVLCHSWDNLTSRGPMPVTPRRLLAWNQINAQEAVEVVDGLKKEDVTVVGIPLFEVYADNKVIGERSNFFESQNLDPQKKLITFTGVTERSCSLQVQKQYVEDLVAAIKDGRLSDCQVYFRMHPKVPQGEMAQWGKDLGIVTSFPRGHERFDDGWIPQDDDLLLQARTVTYSDVCINVASTMTIHCALTKTPVVCPAFDADSFRDYHRSVRRVYDYNHNVKILNLGYAAVVKKREYFIQTVIDAMNNPVDEKARQKVVELYADRVDGKASQRLETALLNELSLEI